MAEALVLQQRCRAVPVPEEAGLGDPVHGVLVRVVHIWERHAATGWFLLTRTRGQEERERRTRTRHRPCEWTGANGLGGEVNGPAGGSTLAGADRCIEPVGKGDWRCNVGTWHHSWPAGFPTQGSGRKMADRGEQITAIRLDTPDAGACA